MLVESLNHSEKLENNFTLKCYLDSVLSIIFKELLETF